MPVAADGADGEVLVIPAGGGAVGQRLLETAIAARVLSVAASRRWRVLAGLNASDADLARLVLAGRRQRALWWSATAATSSHGWHCALSISQAGCNTTLEVLASGAPSVMVPFAGGRESEQTLRTDLLAQRAGWNICRSRSSRPSGWLKAVDRALARPRRAQPIPIDLQGPRDRLNGFWRGSARAHRQGCPARLLRTDPWQAMHPRACPPRSSDRAAASPTIRMQPTQRTHGPGRPLQKNSTIGRRSAEPPPPGGAR